MAVSFTYIHRKMVDTISLTPGQKEGLCICLRAIEAGVDTLREEFPELAELSLEKVITFLKEVEILQTLDKAMKEDFQPCSNAYETALDAVGDKKTVQVKDIAGRSPNTSRITMKPKWTVGEYAREMIAKSGPRKAFFAVRNRARKEICIVPAKGFSRSRVTYVSWGQLVSEPGAKVIRG